MACIERDTRPVLRRGLFHRSLAASLMVGMAGMGFAGCSQEPTEIVAGMTTQINVGKDLSVVGVTVRLGGRFVFCQGYDVVNGTVTLPSTLGVVPSEDRDAVPADPVTVEVVGFRGDLTTAENFSLDCSVSQYNPGEGDVRILRRRRMPYFANEIIFLPMPLKESCANVPCDENETCIGGVCEPADIDNSSLEAYADELIFGNTNTCFSPDRCLPLTASLPAIPVGDPSADDWDCTYTLPQDPNADPIPTTPGAVNVEVIYGNFNTEILDLDDKEGFVIPDPNDPLTFRLAQNLCTSQIKADEPKIIGLRAAPLCPAKRALQPICEDELRDIQEGARSPVSNLTNLNSLCTVSLPLTPADSALYVLLDKSDSMREYFSPDSLQFALGLSLRNPIAAKTEIAFDYLTSQQGAGDFCADNPNPYLTPTVPFGEAEAVQPLIAAELAAPTGGIDPNDGDRDIEIAIDGAFDALRDKGQGQTFNRRALVLVSNRELTTTCAATTETLADQAATEQTGAPEDFIFTYVAALEPGPMTMDPSNVANDGTIATSGGTTIFDGVSDPAEGAQAVQQILNDLGSCVYDLREGQAASATATRFEEVFNKIDMDGTEVQLSYLDPVNFDRTDIPEDASCTAATQTTANGWARNGAEVRICGQACDALRTTLDDTAAFFAVQGQPAPALPIHITVPCSLTSGIESSLVTQEDPMQ